MYRQSEKKLVKQQYLLYMSSQIWRTSAHLGDQFGAPLQISTGFASWQHYCTASSSGRQPNVAALNRGRHLYSAGRPSRWALAHILVIDPLTVADTVHRWLDESRHGSLRDRAVERVADGVGSNSRHSRLRERQRPSHGRLVRLLSTVLDAARPATDVRRVASPAAQNVRRHYIHTSRGPMWK